MSQLSMPWLQKPLQATLDWLQDLNAILQRDEHAAYAALRAVLQTLRDRLPVSEAADLESLVTARILIGIFEPHFMKLSNERGI